MTTKISKYPSWAILMLIYMSTNICKKPSNVIRIALITNYTNFLNKKPLLTVKNCLTKEYSFNILKKC